MFVWCVVVVVVDVLDFNPMLVYVIITVFCL